MRCYPGVLTREHVFRTAMAYTQARIIAAQLASYASASVVHLTPNGTTTPINIRLSKSESAYFAAALAAAPELTRDLIADAILRLAAYNLAANQLADLAMAQVTACQTETRSAQAIYLRRVLIAIGAVGLIGALAVVGLRDRKPAEYSAIPTLIRHVETLERRIRALEEHSKTTPDTK